MKFLTGKSVSRRQILRGVGAGLALPMLDAMLPAARAIAQEPVAPKRFGAVFVPHGERPGFWNPATVGANFQPSVILEPLRPHLDELTIVSQLATRASVQRDAHLVKYTLACLDAAAADPPQRRLYLAAAASLVAWWAVAGAAPLPT